ncbi:MAG: IS630 transposase-related protein [Rickettsiales bacterium]
MPKAYSEDLRIRSVEAYRAGVSADEVADRFDISRDCVYRWNKILQETGELKPLYKAGDRSKIADDEKFQKFAEERAHCTLSEMASGWETELSIHAISRKLKKLGITRKKKHSTTRRGTRKSGKDS